MELDWRIIFVTVLVLAAIFWQRQLGELLVQAKEALYSRVAFLGTDAEELEADKEMVSDIDLEALQALGSSKKTNDSLALEETSADPVLDHSPTQEQAGEEPEPEVAGTQTRPTEVLTGVGGSEITPEDVLIEIQFEINKIQEEIEEIAACVVQLQEAQSGL